MTELLITGPIQKLSMLKSITMTHWYFQLSQYATKMSSSKSYNTNIFVSYCILNFHVYLKYIDVFEQNRKTEIGLFSHLM